MRGAKITYTTRGTAVWFSAILAASVTLTAISQAKADIVEFRGGGYLSDFSSECASGGWSGTTFANFRYRPPNLGDNGASTRIAFYLSHYAESYRLNSGKLTKKFKAVAGGGTGSTTSIFSGKTKVRIAKQQPSKISDTTDSIDISGEINNFNAIPKCSASFIFGAVQRP